VEGDGAREAIVVGTDGSDTAARAIDEAVRLAKALGAVVHVVSGYEPVRGARISGAPEGGTSVLPDSQVEAILEQSAATVRIAGAEVETHAVPGDAVDALLQVAEQIAANLIVVGSRGMHGAKRVLGSVPNSVSHRARCNVLIVATDEP
jgi:nucleotide-binding universal stress UspA family protein